jgi:signal transduction histidine kinase
MERRYRAEAPREQVQIDCQLPARFRDESLLGLWRRVLTDYLPVRRNMSWSDTGRAGMVNAYRAKPEAFLENYCSRLGTLLEARYTGLALLAAKQEADAAAEHANQAMLEAKAADLAKTRFLANMAHELRTPLNAIIGFSEIIKLDVIRTKDRYPQYAEYIHDAGTLLLNIINGLLDLARIQAGQVDLDEQIVAVGELVQAAICTIAPIAEKKSIYVECELADASTLICVDQTKFRQIIFNLLSNGVKFTEPEGQILIGSGYNSRGDLVISIEDTGIGIPPEHLERVLSPFEQVADHLTKESEGTGLGLPIARALIELHGGNLTLSSDLGVGTTVALRLPHERIHGIAP